MKPFWTPIKEPPYVGLKRPEPKRNWSLIWASVAVCLILLLLALGAYADKVVAALRFL